MPTPSRIELPRMSTPEARGDRAQQRADAVHGQTDREAPLAAVRVGQLAAGDHQRRHHQQEDRDRDLDALHGGVQVLADVVDHHVHVRAGEAADELRQRQRQQDARAAPAEASWWTSTDHPTSSDSFGRAANDPRSVEASRPTYEPAPRVPYRAACHQRGLDVVVAMGLSCVFGAEVREGAEGLTDGSRAELHAPPGRLNLEPWCARGELNPHTLSGTGT